MSDRMVFAQKKKPGKSQTELSSRRFAVRCAEGIASKSKVSSSKGKEDRLDQVGDDFAQLSSVLK